jgi:outer membrane lipoprotein SlyB
MYRYLAALTLMLSLAACQPPGADLAPNVYGADQVNQQQQAKVVNILAIMPARIAVDNAQARAAAQMFGGVLGAAGGAVLGNNLGTPGRATLAGGVVGGATGAIAGSLVPGTALVDGVSLTYVEDDKTFNSAQVGQICEFQPGKAIVISTQANETRVQPNAVCPEKTAAN